MNWLDFKARNYDPALGRWMNIDPLAEISRKVSPYTYVLNNPIMYIDPDGMHVELGKNTVDNRELNQEEIDKIMAGLQGMTDDTLVYNKKTGRVEISKKGKGKKTEGTKLLRDLIGHKNTATINIAVSTEKNEFGDNYAMAGASSGSSDETARENFTNGVGDNTEVTIGGSHPYLAQDVDTGEVSVEDMSFQDMLNHELPHAIGQMNGEEATGEVVRGHATQSGGSSMERIDREEAVATFTEFIRPSKKGISYPSENSLRREQGNKKQRIRYSKPKTN